jgi:hypothetical protein
MVRNLADWQKRRGRPISPSPYKSIEGEIASFALAANQRPGVRLGRQEFS